MNTDKIELYAIGFKGNIENKDFNMNDVKSFLEAEDTHKTIVGFSKSSYDNFDFFLISAALDRLKSEVEKVRKNYVKWFLFVTVNDEVIRHSKFQF